MDVPTVTIFCMLALLTSRGLALPVELNSTTIEDVLEQEACPSPSEEFVSPMIGRPKCCSTCPLGEGMLQLCTNTTQTVCRRCQNGEEFSSIASATAKCMQCKNCQELHPFAKVRDYCTPTRDTVCECIPGYFFIESRSTCQSCEKCPPGSGATKPCSWNEDTICATCPQGTWSSSESATDGCQTCRKCKPGQIEMRPCSPTKNTLCCPLNNPNCQDSEDFVEIADVETPPRPRNTPANKAPIQSAYSEDYPMITIYCSLLGLVILTLLIYVIFKIWQQRLLAKDGKVDCEAGGDHVHPAFVELSKSKSGSNSSTPGSRSSSLSKQNKTKATPPPKTVEGQHLLGEPKMYSDVQPPIPFTTLNDIGRHLSADCKWKQVGQLLGYNDDSLQAFERQGDQTAMNPAPATQMLFSWISVAHSQSQDPVAVLTSALEQTPGASHLSLRLKPRCNSSC